MGHPPRTERHKQPTRIEFHVKHYCGPNATQLLEMIPDSADRDYTVEQAELAHRYGTPWPVSADLTNRRYGKVTGNLTAVAKGTHR